MSDLVSAVDATIERIEEMPPKQIDDLRSEIEEQAKYYNIPGVSETLSDQLIIQDNPDDTVSQTIRSPYGGSSRHLTVNGVDLYFPGRDPYVVPILDDEGNLSFYSPDFYRWIGHHATPVANKVDQYREGAAKAIEEISGQPVNPDRNPNHHGVGQCRKGEVKKLVTDDGTRYMQTDILHIPDKANLYEFHERILEWFTPEGDHVEEIHLTNTNNFAIPVSLLRHPYMIVPKEFWDQAVIKKLGYDEEGNVETEQVLFELKDYETDGEQRFDELPLLEDGMVVEFDRGDAVVQIMFEGDYPETAGLQVFSNGYLSGDESKDERVPQTVIDFKAKFAMHREKLRQAQRLYDKLGIDLDIYDEEALDAEEATFIEMLQNVCAVCIEDNTSQGNIYADEEAVDTAVVLQPKGEEGDTKIFRRTTRVIPKAA